MNDAPTPGSNEARALLQGLYAEMAPQHLYPLWEVLHALVTPEPTSAVQPHLWHYDTARAHLLRAGDLITAAQAERRVLILENPGLPGSSAVTTSLYAGLQLILPGEVAPCHRHTQCALRFVMEGGGAFTALDGEKAIMQPFDLVLTPNWQWHDHGNTSDRPMIWLDGLDIPTVRFYAASFAERLPDGAMAHPETAPPGDTRARYGRNLRPFGGTSAARRPADLPLFHYPYAEWRESLAAMARAGEPDAHLGHALEFANPADGGPVMPTIAAHVRLLPKGFRTQPRQSTDATVFVVVEGSGTARIGEAALALGPRDLFVVPAWARLDLDAAEEMVLFAYSDAAAQRKLGLWRERRL